jgi:hypothetical protein
MDTSTFRREDQKYSALWVNGYKDANWKRLARAGLRLAESLDGNPTLIDFGFGRGSAMDFFEGRGVEVAGVEISSYAISEQLRRGRKVYHSGLDNLAMLEDDQYNIGFCSDVIEHVPEDLVVPSLDEMTRVCLDYLLLSVCPTPSHHLSLDGENLHLTVRPESWWEELFQKYGEFQRVRFRCSRSARYAIDLKACL